MTQQAPIMVLADQNPDISGTISLARRIAEARSAHLSVVGFTKMVNTDPTYRSSLEETVKRACRGFEDHDLLILDDGDIAGWVIDRCALGKAQIVVKTGHRSETIFYSPLDWRLIRECPAPVLFVNGAENHSAMQTIVATVDVEDTSPEQTALNQGVMEQANGFIQSFGGVLHGAVCIETSRVLSDLDLVDPHKREQAHAPEVREAIGRDYSQYDIKPENWHIHAGPPDSVLKGIANGIGADLVVVGTVGRKRLQGMLLGNTAEKLLGSIRANVLVIKA